MSDNLTRYCAIRDALKQLCPHEPRGNHARHLQTLAHLVSGIVGSRKTSLPAIAAKVPSGGSPKGGGRESRVKRYARWLGNDRIDAQTYFLPYARALLESLPPAPLVLVIDGSPVGRGCQALVISVLHGKRALPLVWSVSQGGKGHASQQEHQDLVRRAAALVPEGRAVVFLGDGEFNGTDLLGLIRAQGWDYACRIGRNSRLAEEDEWFSLSWLSLSPGWFLELPDVCFTKHGFGPALVAGCLVAGWWRRGDDGPLYLVSSMELAEEAFYWYRKRFQIETFFSDQKSRGFYLCHCHLSDPMRLCRLMIATCLAHIWMVCLGAQVVRRGWLPVIHRAGRCDLSLFQIGLLWLDHCLCEAMPVPVTLRLTGQRDAKSVR